MATPDLVFKPLESGEIDLAESLIGVAAVNAPETESFGFDANGPTPRGTPWGLFIRDTLSAAAWVDAAANPIRVAAIAVPRRQWKTGLTTWMLQELAKTYPGRGMTITIEKGGRDLGETLEDAGFQGPDSEEETYPVGEWTQGEGAAVAE